jgi:spore maturation protein CgeB
MDLFFKNNEIITYDSISDLADKIKYFTKNDKLRKKIAKSGKDKYFKLFNETKISKFIVDRSIGKKVSLI